MYRKRTQAARAELQAGARWHRAARRCSALCPCFHVSPRSCGAAPTEAGLRAARPHPGKRESWGAAGYAGPALSSTSSTERQEPQRWGTPQRRPVSSVPAPAARTLPPAWRDHPPAWGAQVPPSPRCTQKVPHTSPCPQLSLNREGLPDPHPAARAQEGPPAARPAGSRSPHVTVLGPGCGGCPALPQHGIWPSTRPPRPVYVFLLICWFVVAHSRSSVF